MRSIFIVLGLDFDLGPLHMSPITGLARGYRDEFCCRSVIWKISALSTGMKSKTNKNFAFSHKKVCHFGSCVAKAKLFCVKRLVSGTQAGVLISENIHPGYRDLGRRNRDLGNRASPASHMNTSEYLRRKEWRAEVSETEPAQLTGLI